MKEGEPEVRKKNIENRQEEYQGHELFLTKSLRQGCPHEGRWRRGQVDLVLALAFAFAFTFAESE